MREKTKANGLKTYLFVSSTELRATSASIAENGKCLKSILLFLGEKIIILKNLCSCDSYQTTASLSYFKIFS